MILKDLKFVLKEYFDAPFYISFSKLRWSYFISGFISLLILGFMFSISKPISDSLYSLVNSYFESASDYALIKLIITILVRIILTLIYYIFYKTVLLICLTPFFSYFSEKLEETLCDKKYDFSFRDNLGFIFRGIFISLKTFFKEIFISLLLVAVSFIPLVNIITPLLFFIAQSYFISFNFLDYTLERNGFNSKETVLFVRKNRVIYTFCGAFFSLLYLIPFFGVLFAPILALTATTVITLKLLDKNLIVSK